MFDICVIGSGAGAGPVIYELANAGYKVVVLEKGPWFKTSDFVKDEIAAVRRSVYTPNLRDERHVIDQKNKKGVWSAKSTYDTGRDFWKGNCVGGSTNFMSGYFHRMKPDDFRLLSTYGEIEGSNVVDWPIAYDDLEPYYAKVEEIVGVSGRIIQHRMQEPRSLKDFPQPPLAENIVSSWLDKAAEKEGYELVPVPRAILSQPRGKRSNCSYSNYCGSYGCSTDAKGSARVALIDKALDTGNCEVKSGAKVFHLQTNGRYRIEKAWYYDRSGTKQHISAKLFVVAARAEETSRLLLMSKNEEFPNGLANNQGQVGKNLLFSAGGVGSGQLFYADIDPSQAAMLEVPGLFVNRSLHHFYEIDDPAFNGKVKGGMVDFLFEHANGIGRAIRQKWDGDELIYGSRLKEKIHAYFTEQRKIKFEVFNDWLPTDDCFVSLDPKVKDKWGDPVARLRTGYHPHDLKVGKYLAKKSEKILENIGAKNIRSSITGSPPSNLLAGGCRFGVDPDISVLDPQCKAHDVDNLYISDGSFMPTGGSVTYTWTIYANAFRIADHILKHLSSL